MPLTLQLYGSANIFGHLIIDRKNLIIGYPSGHNVSMNSLLVRRKIINAFSKINLNHVESIERNFANTADDRRHVVVEHMSTYNF